MKNIFILIISKAFRDNDVIIGRAISPVMTS
jgi:hypothetical protein